jgi:hypothetical protein
MTPLTTKKFHLRVDYLGEFESIYETALAQIELFDEKNRGRKPRDRVPLTNDILKLTMIKIFDSIKKSIVGGVTLLF